WMTARIFGTTLRGLPAMEPAMGCGPGVRGDPEATIPAGTRTPSGRAETRPTTDHRPFATPGCTNNDYRYREAQGQAGVARNRDGRGSIMKIVPKAGMTGELSLTVDASNRISFADDRMPAVLATPWLVAHLEYAARRAIDACL